jgi:signal transduction histidine kinase
MVYLLAVDDLTRYNSQSDIVDLVGNQVFLAMLAVVFFRSRGAWRSFYLHFLGAFATYAFASFVINHGISVGNYYTGSLYDVPFTSAIAWFCVLSITHTVDSQSDQSQSDEAPKSKGRLVGSRLLWSARLSMVATLSTPMIGLWLIMSGDIQDPVRHFRILLTLSTMLLLTILLFLKQDLLNFKLGGYLREATSAYSNLRRFEDQLVQNEKLASLGKLVARVAYEINGAMTEVGKDVDALSSSPGAQTNRQKMTAKIGDAARRTRSLVERMLSFAQEMPVYRSSVKVRPLLESAWNLTRAERRHHVRVEIKEQGGLSAVEGDANQLVQVFLHLIANAIDAMEGNEAALLTITIRAEQEHIEIAFVDTGSGLKDPRRVFEPFYSTKQVGKGVGLGLSTCYGIIRQHGGEIDCYNRPEGGAVFRLVLPAAVAAPMEAVS